MSDKTMTKLAEDGADAQRRRFEEAARAVGADESPESLDRAMGKLNLKVKPKPEEEAPPDGE